MILTKNQSTLKAILISALEISATPNLQVIGNLDKDGQLMGIVGFDNWTGLYCEMHMWGKHPRWVTPKFMHAIFHYPFVVTGCEFVLARIDSGNIHSLDIAKRVGFRTECVLAGAYPDGDLHILSMRKDNCRWLERHYGFQSESTASA